MWQKCKNKPSFFYYRTIFFYFYSLIVLHSNGIISLLTSITFNLPMPSKLTSTNKTTRRDFKPCLPSYPSFPITFLLYTCVCVCACVHTHTHICVCVCACVRACRQSIIFEVLCRHFCRSCDLWSMVYSPLSVRYSTIKMAIITTFHVSQFGLVVRH